MKAMICLILDRSGSMGGRESDVVGGVNKFLEEQKALPDPASIAMVRFNTKAVERFRAMQSLAEFEPLKPEEFKPRGGTPLMDAIGQTLVALDDDWKREQPDRGILVIVTDGEENSSREYTKTKIKEMIQARQDSGKWAIIYLGANVDAFSEARSMGIFAANSAGYNNTANGINAMYAAASSSVGSMRSSGVMMASNLGRNIGEGGVDSSAPQTWVTTDAVPTQPTTPCAWQPPTTGAWAPPQ